MSNVQLNYTQIIDPVSFKSVPSGKIYIGEYGTLPNPANAGTWKQAYFVNSDGTRTAASQPIATNAAGYAVDGSGNIKTVQVDGQYSLLIQDRFGATKFSNPVVEPEIRADVVGIVSVRDYIKTAIDGSTSNQAGIVDAVSAAYAAGAQLYWPAGMYVSDANIPNFHSVQHVGSGVIKRGSNLFYISGRGTNNLFADPSGSASNDGLSSGQPTTLQKACDYLYNWAEALLENGTFKVNLSAGTYSGNVRMFGLRSKNRIQFVGASVGGHPNVPTTIIDGLANSDPYGLYFQQYMYVYVQDIKFQRFTTGSDASGLVADQHVNLQTKNVHTANNGYAGVSVNSMSYLYLEGGLHNNSCYSIRVYSNCTYTIGYNGSAGANRPQVTGAATGFSGILITNASQGHVDYTDIFGCSGSGGGLQLTNQSRADIVTCTFGAGTPNYYNIRMDTQSTYIDNGITFNAATARSVVSWGYSIENASQTNVYYDKALGFWRFGPTTNIVPSTMWHFQKNIAPSVAYNSSALIALEDTGSPYFAFGTSNASGEAGFMWAKPGSTLQGKFYYNYSDDTIRMVTGGTANTYRWSTTFFVPPTDNSVTNGSAVFRWSTVYAGTGTINTSDGREKTTPLSIDDAVLDAWGDVQLITFQWLDSIRQKGEDAARWHFGVIAQQVRDAFSEKGLDGTRYGLLCYDEWEDQYEPVVAVRENPETGEQEEFDTGEKRLVLAAGDRWGIRADQCLFLEAAYQRRRCDRIEQRLNALEDK